MEGRHWARLHLKEIRIRFIRICFTPHTKESLEIVSFLQLYLTKCRSALSFQHLPFPSPTKHRHSSSALISVLGVGKP